MKKLLVSNLLKAKGMELLRGWSQVQSRQCVVLLNTLHTCPYVANYSDNFGFCSQCYFYDIAWFLPFDKMFFTQTKYHPLVSI